MACVLTFALLVVGLPAASAAVPGGPSEGDADPAVDSGGAEVLVLDSDGSWTVLDVKVRAVDEEETPAGGQVFQRLSIAGRETTLEVGKPQLPAIRELVAIPDGATVTASVVDSSFTTTRDYHVFPVQEPEVDGQPTPGFTIDSEFYSIDAFYPRDLLEVDEPGIWRDITVAGVQINPVQFNPATGELRVYDRVRIRLDYAGGSVAPKKVAPAFARMYQSAILNYDSLDVNVDYGSYEDQVGTHDAAAALPEVEGLGLDGTPYDSSVKLLSLRHESCSDFSTLLPLLEWHKSEGLPYISAVYHSTPTASSLKSTIASYYDDYPELEYVLLVGDTAYLPWQQSWGPNDTPGDHWYACITGGATPDLYADVGLGRLSVTSDAQLQQQVDKILDYAKSPPAGSWVNRAILMAHKEAAPGKYQGCCEDIRTATYSDSFTFWTDYGAAAAQGGDDATNADVTADLNSGVGILNYRGHGGDGDPYGPPYGEFWGTNWNTSFEEYTVTDAHGLTNGDNAPVVFSISCTNAWLDAANEVLGEAFVRDSDSAVAFLGASRPSYTTPNHEFDKNLFDAIGNEHITRLGWILNDANAELVAAYGSGSYYMDNVRMYLWLGDPALDLWTSSPQSLVVDHPAQVTTSMTVAVQDVMTNPVPNALVCLHKYGDIYAYAYTNTMGEASFSFNPSTDGMMDVVVTKHNYYPYEGQTEVVPLENAITNIAFTPSPPASLCNGEHVDISFDYSTDEEDGVRIQMTPFTEGSPTPGYGWSGSTVYPKGEGSGSTWFTILSGDTAVDQVRFQMKTADWNTVLIEFFVPVAYTFGHSVHDTTMDPISPADLIFGEHVDIGFDYYTCETDGVVIFVKPYTGGPPTPNYLASGSDVYPKGSGTGSGWFTVTSGVTTVDQVHVEMMTADQTTTLLDFLVDVSYQYAGHPDIWVEPTGIEVELYPDSYSSSILEIGNTGEGALEYNIADVETTGGPFIEWVAVTPDPLPAGDPGTLTAEVHDPDGLGDISWVKWWVNESPTDGLHMYDDGMHGDGAAGDGVYGSNVYGATLYGSEIGMTFQAGDSTGKLGHRSYVLSLADSGRGAAVGLGASGREMVEAEDTTEEDAAPGEEANDQVSSTGSNVGDASDAPGFPDIHFDYDLQAATGDIQCVGVEFDGTNFYVTGANSGSPNMVYVLDRKGNPAGSFAQDPAYSASTWGWRDLAWDGSYLYGSESSSIVQFETDGTVVGTIPGPISPCRGLAYDPAGDHFWTAGFGTNVYEIDRSGTVVNAFSNPYNVYGLAWDDVSPGGPWLWVFAQEGSPAVTAYQFDPVAGAYTGLSFVSQGEVAGGACFTTELEPPYGILAVVSQGYPDALLGHEICQLDCDWLDEWPMSGTVPLSQTPAYDEIEVGIDSTGLAPGEYTAEVHVANNDPSGNPTIVPVKLTVLPEPNIWTNPDVLQVEMLPYSEWLGTVTIGNSGDGTLDYNVVDIETTGSPYFEWVTQAPDPLPSASSGKIEAMVGDPDGLADIDYVKVWFTEHPSIWTWMLDDGVAPDVTAGDGVYTCVTPGTKPSEDFGLLLQARDMAGNLGHTSLEFHVDFGGGPMSSTANPREWDGGAWNIDIGERPRAGDGAGSGVADEVAAPAAPGAGAVSDGEGTDAPGFSDIRFSYDVEGASGDYQCLGVEFDGTNFYVTGGNSGGGAGDPNQVHMFDRAGTYVGSFPQDPTYSTSSWGWRDLAWDGAYLYGSENSDIVQFGTNGTVTGTIAGPINPCRGLAYDPATDHFWTAGFGTDIYEIDRSGIVVKSFVNTYNVYGLAWDDVSPGGPWLWVFSQDGSPAATVRQFDPVTGVYTGVSFSSVGTYAGGACFVTDVEPQYGILVALNQGYPDMLVGHEICQLNCPWLGAAPTPGTVGPGSMGTLDVVVNSSGLDRGEHTAEMYIESNDPDEDPTIIPVQLTVLPSPDIDVEPRSIDIELPPDTIWNAPIDVSNDGDDGSTLKYQMVDTETTGGPFIKWAKSVPNPIPEGDVGAIMAEVIDPDGLADVDSVRFWVTKNPSDWNYMHDDGVAPDQVAGDGIYSSTANGVSMYGTEFGVTVEAVDLGGPVCHITHVQKVELTDDGSGQSFDSYSGRSALDAEGDIEVLYQQEVAVAEGDVNAEGVTSVVRAAYSWGDADGAGRSILVYTDDMFVEPGQTYVELALRELGLAYTCYYDDYAGFGAALTAGTWDLVLVSHNNRFQFGDYWSEIEDYVNAGGKVVIETFDIDGSHSEATTLWNTLGVAHSSDMGSAEPLYRWQPAHPVFQGIENLSDLTTYTAEYNDNGDKCDAVSPTIAVGGFAAGPTSGQGGIFSGSIVNSFVISNFRSDDDGDGKLDAVELWKNEIMYTMFGSDCDWLSETPTEGSLGYGMSDEVMLSIDTSGLALGEYSAEVYVAGNDLNEGVTFVPVRLTVAPPVETGSVLFDETHSPVNSSEAAMKHWAELLRAWGFVVDRATTVPTTYGELLEGYCAVIIPGPTADYTEAEIAALQDYVDHGGGLLITGEWGDYAQMSGLFPVVNELAASFDMWFNDDAVCDYTYNDGNAMWPLIPDFEASVAGANVDEAVMYFGCSVGGNGTAFPIAWTYSSAYAATADADGEIGSAGTGYARGEAEDRNDSPPTKEEAPTEVQDGIDVSTGEPARFGSEFVELKPLVEVDGGYDVLWDLTHGVYLGYEPGVDYSSLVALLGSAGYSVDTTTAGVENVNLNDYAVLVVCLGSSWDTAYTAGEVAAIEAFVENGGGLLVLGDNEGCPNSNINPVPQAFGTTCGLSTLSPTDVYVSDMDEHPIFEGVSEFYLRAAGEVDGISPSQEMAWTPMDAGEPVATVATQGNGRIVALGDFNLWQDEHLAKSQNQLFAENTFNWLAEPSQPGPPVMAASVFGAGRAMIIGDGNLFDYLDYDEDSPSALYEYDNQKLALNIIDWLCQPRPDLVIEEKWEEPTGRIKHLHSFDDPPLYPGRPIEEPLGTGWHELYPEYCNRYAIDGWIEPSPDGVLSPGDIVSLGGVDHHVGDLTATMFVTPEGGDQIALEYIEGYEYVAGAMSDPEGTYWYSIHPHAFDDYLIARWKDASPAGLSAGDLILLTDVETGAELTCDVDEVAWDLVVSPVLDEMPGTYRVCYQVANIGNAAVPAGHSVTLYVDEAPVEHMVVPVDLGPGGRYTDCFRTIVECTPSEDLVVVCADNYEQVVEADEVNNCTENIYECPCEPAIDVQKTVWDDCGEKWVKIACVPIESAATFRITIENTGDCCDLLYMEVTDWLPTRTSYVPGSATVNGIPWEPSGMSPLGWSLELAPVPPGGNVTLVFDATVDEWSADIFGNLVEVEAWCEGTGISASGSDEAALQPFIPGDANMNGAVNMQDVTYTELIILGYLDPTCGADANLDCTINMGDVTTIELMILGYL